MRITHFDLLRSIAIIGVVAIHTTGIGYTFPEMSLDFNLTVLWRQIINFSVPMFIAISGYFLANKDLTDKTKYFSFLKRQVLRVLIPYVFWSIGYLTIQFMSGHSISSLMYKLFTFQSIVPFYFVALIIEYYILLPT